MIDGNWLVSCRMYPGGWPEIQDGFAKNILAGHGNSVFSLIISIIFHWLVFIFPWAWWIFGGGLIALGLGLTGIGLRGLSAAMTHQRVKDALLMPISVLLMTLIAVRSIIWHYTGKAIWKGRQVKVGN
jgi:chlorobactene glucosyltransferase